jgi:cobaltochelatase CobT
MKNDKTKDLEAFKSATAAALRALARRNDVEVTFAPAEGSARNLTLPKGKARLPLPDALLSDDSKTLTRGQADARALSLLHHNDRMHRANAPLDLTAQAAFDALEQARTNALGARDMQGVADNLNASLDDQCRQCPKRHEQYLGEIFLHGKRRTQIRLLDKNN